MTKLSVLLCVAVLASAAAGGAAGAATPLSSSRWDLDETAPTLDDVASAAAHARAMHCRTSSCRANIVIHELADIAEYEIGDTNGGRSLGNRPQIAGRRLDRALLDHPELYGPVCEMAVKFVSRVHPDLNVMFIPVTPLMNGVDMDLRDHGHCARDLVAALPRDPANDLIRINARDVCVNGYENHHRPQAACAVLAEGVKEK